MTEGDRIRRLALREIHFSDSFNTNWLCVSMKVFLQASGHRASAKASQTSEYRRLQTENARRPSDARFFCWPFVGVLFATVAALSWQFGQAHRHAGSVTLSENFYVYCLADLMLIEDLEQIVVAVNLLAIHPDDNIPNLEISVFSLNHAAQAGVSSSTAGCDTHDQHAGGHRQLQLPAQRRDIARSNAQFGP